MDIRRGERELVVSGPPFESFALSLLITLEEHSIAFNKINSSHMFVKMKQKLCANEPKEASQQVTLKGYRSRYIDIASLFLRQLANR